jgi:hypothetical protein
MGLGPFDSFVFPGVYTKTLNEPPLATAAGDIRVPAFIGVGEESIPVDNYEMIRGSSSMADNKIVKEDVSSQVTGMNRNFNITYTPIVKGDGTGTVSTDVNTVVAYVNGNSVPVASVNGTTGEIYLVNLPMMGDTVLITYYFKQTDTLHANEDISDQADGINKLFQVHFYPIVQGDNGGITTTDPSRLSVKVNGIAATITAVDGDTGQFTLSAAPAMGTAVWVTYYSNELQHTSDILPSPYVAGVTKVGYAPGTSDFVEGVDFVLDSTGAFYTLNWGHSYKMAYGQHTIGTTYFFAQMTGTMYDNRNLRRLATGTSDGTNKTFIIEATPVTGEGRGIDTENPDLLEAFYGTSPTDATAIDISKVNPTAKSITLATPPPAGKSVFVTQYSNLLPDDRWTLTATVEGGSGTGKYTMSGVSSGVAMDTVWSASDTTVSDSDFAAENVTYPAGTGTGNSDAQVMPGYAVQETVSLTFMDTTSYFVSSNVPIGTGSSGDNTGYLNQTYMDKKTGFRVTIKQGNLVVYGAGDVIGYSVTPSFTAGSTPERGVPGLKVRVTDTLGVGVGDTGLINTYNKSGAEPKVGDFYYVSFNETKQFDSNGLTEPKLYTQESDVFTDTGRYTINNKLGMAAHMAFLNGAQAVVLLQIKKTEGDVDAPSSRYIAGIDAFNMPMQGGLQPTLMQPVTTSADVINYLKTSNTIQSSIRYANEHRTYFGFALNTTPTVAQAFARAMNSERMVGIYPDGAVTTVTDELGIETEFLVDGSIMASAIAGRDVSPAFDVAEPLTRKPVVGFRRLYRRMDAVTAAQTSNAGLTLLEEVSSSIDIKFALTTDLSSVLTRTPSIIRTKDFIQRGSRSILQPYIGQKLMAGKTSEIETTLKSYMSALQQAGIITAFTGIAASVDPNDPTIINVVAYYSPVFPLLWIVITFNLRSNV